jgi:hypothetical protein
LHAAEDDAETKRNLELYNQGLELQEASGGSGRDPEAAGEVMSSYDD